MDGTDLDAAGAGGCLVSGFISHAIGIAFLPPPGDIAEWITLWTNPIPGPDVEFCLGESYGFRAGPGIGCLTCSKPGGRC